MPVSTTLVKTTIVPGRHVDFEIQRKKKRHPCRLQTNHLFRSTARRTCFCHLCSRAVSGIFRFRLLFPIPFIESAGIVDVTSLQQELRLEEPVLLRLQQQRPQGLLPERQLRIRRCCIHHRQYHSWFRMLSRRKMCCSSLTAYGSRLAAYCSRCGPCGSCEPCGSASLCDNGSSLACRACSIDDQLLQCWSAPWLPKQTSIQVLAFFCPFEFDRRLEHRPAHPHLLTGTHVQSSRNSLNSCAPYIS